MSNISEDDKLILDRFEALMKPAIKVVYAAVHVEFMSLAAQFVLCVYGLSRYRRTTASQTRRPYIVLSFVMLGLFTYASVTDSIDFARMTINNPNEGFASFFYTGNTPWYFTLGTVCNAIVISLGDGILIYRCHFIWHRRRWVIVVPSLALTASIAMSALFIITDDDNTLAYYTAWIALSVAANSMSTALIAGKLVYERHRLSKILPRCHLVKYMTATAILVESAVPLTLFGVAACIVIAQSTNVVLMALFPSVWFCLSGVCPQLIMFRVAVGSSYPDDFDEKSEILSRPIQFAQERSAVETRSVSAVETKTSSSPPTETV